jgi:hypothetical protein
MIVEAFKREAEEKHKEDELERGSLLLLDIQQLINDAVEIYNEAKKAKQFNAAANGIRATLACVQFKVELVKEEDPNATFSTNNPEWLKLEDSIFSALEDYPEAREKLAEALKAVND